MQKKSISIIIPCLNEEKFILGILKDILAQDYPKELMEVFFVDGGSEDQTQSIINSHIEKFPFIHLLKNPDRFVPHAMNLGIKSAKGDIIIRLDAHASYPSDYFSKLVFWQEKLKTDNVGGLWKIKPRNNSNKAFSISKILAHPLGVGNASYRLGTNEPTEVDTVPFGCFPKNGFEKFGYYDLRLHRNQDIELNKRIARQGGKIILVPEITCTYFAREHFTALWKNNFANGKWVILTAYYTGSLNALSFRHFVPLFFSIYFLLLLFSACFSLFLKNENILFLIQLFYIPAVIYFLAIILASLRLSIEEKRLGLFPYSIFSFFILHLSYGFGSLMGIFNWKSNTKSDK